MRKRFRDFMNEGKKSKKILTLLAKEKEVRKKKEIEDITHDDLYEKKRKHQ